MITDRNLSLIVFMSALSVGHKIGIMFIITVSALATFQSNCQFLHVWQIQKQHIVVQYSLALNKPRCTRNSLFLELFVERLLVQLELVTNDHEINSVPSL